MGSIMNLGLVREQQSELVLVFVTFNFSDAACEILRYIDNERTVCDVVVLDNNSAENHYQQLFQQVSGMPRASLLRMSTNLGGSGGYYELLRFCLKRTYSHILITEDDAEPEEPGLIDEIFKNRSPKRRVTAKFINAKCPSFSFHFHLYPRELLENAGLPDPSLFMIHDDLDFALRINRAEVLLKFQKQITVNYGYWHPQIKGFIGSTASIYLSVRNSLIVSGKNQQGLVGALAQGLGWSFFSFSFLLCEGKATPMRAVLCGLRDFLLEFDWKEINGIRLEQFREKIAFSSDIVPVDDYDEFDVVNKTVISRSLLLAVGPLKNTSGRISSVLLGRDCVSRSLCTPWFPVLLWSRRVWVLHSVDPKSSKFALHKWDPSYHFRRLKGLMGVVMGLFFSIIWIPCVIIKYFHMAGQPECKAGRKAA